MLDWFEGVAGSAYAPALMWTLLALLALIVILVAIRVVRSLTGGTFIAGGRNRRARLAVMDAAAVDATRRLVLVRRDDVEHLILIGGTSDLVVEQNIGLALQRRAPATGMEFSPAPVAVRRPEPDVETPPPAPPAPPRAQTPSVAPPLSRPERQEPERIEPETPQVEPRRPEPAFAAPPQRDEPRERTAPAVAAASTAAVAAGTYREPAFEAPGFGAAQQPVYSSAVQTYAAAPAARAPEPQAQPEEDTPVEFDDALLKELEGALEIEQEAPQPEPAVRGPAEEDDLDAEMSRLLGDLSAPRR